MNNFFTQSLNNSSKISDVLDPNVEKLEPNTSGNFFTQTSLDFDLIDPNEFDVPEIFKIENFFRQSTGEYNFIREYSKGKSFKFSNWNESDTYNNDEFVQDFVKYDKKLWACVSKVPVVNIPPYESNDKDAPWELILEGVSDIEFRQVGNQIQWKYEDNNEWYLLFELASVSKQEILDLLDNLNIEYRPYDELLEFKEYTISELNKKVDKVKGKDLSTNDFTNELKSKLESLSNYNDSEIRNLINSESDRAKLAEKTISDAVQQNKNSINSLSQSVETQIDKLDAEIEELNKQIIDLQDQIENLEGSGAVWHDV